MIYKLRTSKATQEIFVRVGSTSGLQPFALAKISLALSLRQEALQQADFQTDNEGIELNRQTIFGEHDLLFRCLIISHENREITENEYFPRLVKAHLDRGAKLLEGEARYSKNLFVNLCNLDSNI